MRGTLDNAADERQSVMLMTAVAVLISVMTIGIFILGAPRFSDLKEYELSPADVSVIPHEGDGPFRRSRVNEQKYTLRTASEIPVKTRRQYTYTFNLEASPKINGEAFIPYIGGTAIAYMNGVRVEETHAFPTRFAGFAHQYIRTEIPLNSYQTGVNRLIIVMTPDKSYAGIPAIYYGDAGVFSNVEKRLHLRQRFVKNGLLISALLAVLLSLLGFSFKLRVKSYRYILIISAGLILLGSSMSFGGAFNFGDVQLFSGIIYALIFVCLCGLFEDKQLRRNPYLLGLWIAAILSIVVALGVLLPIAPPFQSQSLAYFAVSGTIPFIGLFCFLCLREDRSHFRQSQFDLEEKLLEQQNIIAEQEADLENALKAKGRLEERQRLTRDIHDGIGGQLLSLLVRVRDGDMSQAEIENDLQYGLNDLRLIVDSMDHSDGTLESALVTFRARAIAQLKAVGVTLKWEKSDPFKPTVLGPAGILNIYRLMQEAVSNAIRHAKCDNIAIYVSRAQISDNLVIIIEDDGVGFDSEIKPMSGQGLKNMQYRAKALGGELQILKGETGGTKIMLTVSV